MSESHDTGVVPQAGPRVMDLLEVRGDLPRLAWAIGARLAACQFAEGRLIVPHDPALEAALVSLGARVRQLQGVFTPDSGTSATDATQRHGRRHVQFHVARMHGDDEADEETEAESGPPATNA